MVKKRTAVLLTAGVLVAGVYAQGQLLQAGFTENNPYAQWDQWGTVFDFNTEIPFSNRFTSGVGPKKYTMPPRPVPKGTALEAIPLDPSYAARLHNLYAYDSFEGAMRSIWTMEMVNEAYSGTISNDYALDGDTSLRVELRKDDPIINGCKRSELALKVSENRLETHTYSVGILLPSGGEEDYALDERGSEIILQWHNVPDEGEQWTTPPLALRTYNGRYVLERCWDDDPYSTDETLSLKNNRATHDLGPYVQDKGRFVQWKFRIKWGWLPAQEPILEIYKDGVEILDLSGLPNTTNDRRGVVMKMGLYKWDWCQRHDRSVLDKRVVYYDRLLIE